MNISVCIEALVLIGFVLSLDLNCTLHLNSLQNIELNDIAYKKQHKEEEKQSRNVKDVTCMTDVSWTTIADY